VHERRITRHNKTNKESCAVTPGNSSVQVGLKSWACLYESRARWSKQRACCLIRESVLRTVLLSTLQRVKKYVVEKFCDTKDVFEMRWNKTGKSANASCLSARILNLAFKKLGTFHFREKQQERFEKTNPTESQTRNWRRLLWAFLSSNQWIWH